MELLDILQQISQQSQRASMPTDLKIGTVVATDPLEISINAAMAPLKQNVLYLTVSVVEKKIPILNHTHITDGFSHTHTTSNLGHSHDVLGTESSTDLTGSYISSVGLGQDAFESDERLTSIACTENGLPLPVENGYIILNRALAVDDKVLLLRVQNGQKFIVLSRVFEVK